MPSRCCFVLIQFTVSGKNGDLLGTDESEIKKINIAIVDPETNKVMKYHVLKTHGMFSNAIVVLYTISYDPFMGSSY